MSNYANDKYGSSTDIYFDIVVYSLLFGRHKNMVLSNIVTVRR